MHVIKRGRTRAAASAHRWDFVNCIIFPSGGQLPCFAKDEERRTSSSHRGYRDASANHRVGERKTEAHVGSPSEC